VWKQLRRLDEYGIVLSSLPGAGYRLDQALELLCPDSIDGQLEEKNKSLLDELSIVDEIDSSNAELLRSFRPGAETSRACLAEFQTTGRGRRGRVWQSPFASGICLSVAWRFPHSMSGLGGLGLALGIAAAETLAEIGISDVQLKWPNDLVIDHRKLGGILLEARGEAEGPCMVVAGIGLNFALGESARSAIDQPWIDIQTAAADQAPGRNLLAGQMLNKWLSTLSEFTEEGFSPFMSKWDRYDLLRSRRLKVERAGHWLHGLGAGIDREGSLLLVTESGMQTISSGEVSVRTDDSPGTGHDPSH
jgi:BirA family biotin operon repressor/biotin-[acetyl-CoA-carboxylase] ligase